MLTLKVFFVVVVLFFFRVMTFNTTMQFDFYKNIVCVSRHLKYVFVFVFKRKENDDDRSKPRHSICRFKYIEISPPKTESFQIKFLF